MSTDLAEVAYNAWAGEMTLAAERAADADPESEVEFPASWHELDDLESAVWIAVEAEYQRMVSEAPKSHPPPATYTLANPLPGPRKANGESLPRGKWPKTSSTFEVRVARAADCLAAEQYDEAEREYRIVNECMKPLNGRWSWSNWTELDSADITALRRLVFTSGERLDGRLYEVYRAEMHERFAVELAATLHRDDVAAFRVLEERGQRREQVLAALTKAAELPAGAGDLAAEAPEGNAERTRWEGDAEWPEMPAWPDVLLRGLPSRYLWLNISLALASSSETGERVRLFSPGLPRELVAQSVGMRGKDLIAMRRGKVPEDKMLSLVASLSGVPRDDLLRTNVDDYERLFLTGQRWLGNRQRERATRPSATALG